MIRLKNYFSKAFVISMTFTLTSCAWFYGDSGIIKNRDTDYLKAYSIPPLRIPSGLSSSTIEAHYPVSDADYPLNAKKVDLTPPGLRVPVIVRKPVYASRPVLRPVPMANVTPMPKPIAHPPRAVAHTKVVPVTTPAALAAVAAAPAQQQQAVAPHAYYDNYTRASTTKSGMPIREFVRSLWPWGKNHTAQITNSQPAPAQAGNVMTKQAPVNTASTMKPAAVVAQNKTSEKTSEKNKAANNMPNIYYDRFTRR